MTKPLVALLQPAAGRSVPYAPAKKAFLRPSARGVDRVELEQGTSMLTRCFNMLWCDALNARRTLPVTHVAMLHDDVAPDGPWLDVLLDELDRTGADVIAAVAPIKNGRGLTSTAVDNPADPWVVRRLTLREVFRLPETFAAADVPWADPGAALLINTGCWVAKLGPWAERVNWRFENRIARMPDGTYVSQDRPEDWLFGGDCAGWGLKVLATRKVALEHGAPEYHTRAAWGDWPTDLAWLEWQRAVAGAQAPEGFVFPADVPGWLTEAEGRRLAALAAGKTVLEIGSYCGRSTVCLAQAAAAVHAVDPHDGRGTSRPRDTLGECCANLVRYGVFGKCRLYPGVASAVVPTLVGPYDLAFVDGGHRREEVLEDARVATAALAPDGLLAFHDYHAADPGVLQAVDQLLAGGAALLDVTDTLAVVRPAATAAARAA